MIKKKIIALFLIIALVASAFVGCSNNVSAKDIKEDPAKYIESGLKKTFAKSPIGDLLEIKDPEAMSLGLNISPEDSDLYVKVDATIALKELAILANLDALIYEDEKMDGSIYLDKENIALKSETLNEIIGSAAVGASLKDFIKNLKASDWYKVLIIDSGLEEEIKNDNGEIIDVQAIIDLFNALIKEVEEICDESIEYTVSESTITYGEKEIEGYQIVQTNKNDVDAKLEDCLKKFIHDLKALLPNEITNEVDIDDEDIEDLLAQFQAKDRITYFIAKKGGVIHKIAYSGSIIIEDRVAEVRDIVFIESEVDFGEDPTKMFAPSFEFTAMNPDVKVTVIGKSGIDIVAQEFKLDIDIDIDYTEDNWWDGAIIHGDIIFVLDKNDNYKLTIASDDIEEKYEGKFKIDGSKIEFTTQVDDGYDVINYSINIDLNAKKPTMFEYDDVMKWDEGKIIDFIEKIQSLNSEEYWDDYDNYN